MGYQSLQSDFMHLTDFVVQSDSFRKHAQVDFVSFTKDMELSGLVQIPGTASLIFLSIKMINTGIPQFPGIVAKIK